MRDLIELRDKYITISPKINTNQGTKIEVTTDILDAVVKATKID